MIFKVMHCCSIASPPSGEQTLLNGTLIVKTLSPRASKRERERFHNSFLSTNLSFYLSQIQSEERLGVFSFKKLFNWKIFGCNEHVWSVLRPQRALSNVYIHCIIYRQHLLQSLYCRLYSLTNAATWVACCNRQTPRMLKTWKGWLTQSAVFSKHRSLKVFETFGNQPAHTVQCVAHIRQPKLDSHFGTSLWRSMLCYPPELLQRACLLFIQPHIQHHIQHHIRT